MTASAIYRGRMQHRRHAPQPHAFDYPIAQLLIDLDELDHLFDGRWFWSVNRRNLAEFRRSDYLGDPDQPLADAVRGRITRALGHAPPGPVRMLAHLRHAGHIFNPVSFYYCYAADGTTLDCIVAEITNTPWQERHAYVLPAVQADAHGRALAWTFDKQFHVSPFLPMDCEYRWRFTAPGDDLHVHMQVWRNGERQFDADLALQRHPLTGPGLARVLLRHPLMTVQVVAAIHWQALRLWLKRTPVHDHPSIAGKHP